LAALPPYRANNSLSQEKHLVDPPKYFLPFGNCRSHEKHLVGCAIKYPVKSSLVITVIKEKLIMDNKSIKIIA